MNKQCDNYSLYSYINICIKHTYSVCASFHLYNIYYDNKICEKSVTFLLLLFLKIVFH